MMLNTHEAAWQHKDKSKETESQDYTVDTDTYVQEVHKVTAFLTLSVRWGKADNDDKRLSDTEFTVKEKELEHHTDLVQK